MSGFNKPKKVSDIFKSEFLCVFAFPLVVKIFFQKRILRSALYIIVAILLPCLVELFSFVGGEIQTKAQHGFHLPWEGFSEDVVDPPVPVELLVFTTIVPLVEYHKRVEEGFMKVNGRFLHFFSIGNAHGCEVADKPADSGPKKGKHGRDSSISHRNTSVEEQVIGGFIGIVAGALLVFGLISRFG